MTLLFAPQGLSFGIRVSVFQINDFALGSFPSRGAELRRKRLDVLASVPIANPCREEVAYLGNVRQADTERYKSA